MVGRGTIRIQEEETKEAGERRRKQSISMLITTPAAKMMMAVTALDLFSSPPTLYMWGTKEITFAS